MNVNKLNERDIKYIEKCMNIANKELYKATGDIINFEFCKDWASCIMEKLTDEGM